MLRRPVGAHPLGRQAAGFAGADVPIGRVKNRGPRSPRFRRFVNAESTGETRVPAGVRSDLAHHVPLQSSAVADSRSVTLAGMNKHMAAILDRPAPPRLRG